MERTDAAKGPDGGPAAYEFELSGGASCLDFANTVSNRGTEPIERLRSYGDLVAWAAQAELIGDGEAAALRRAAEARPGEAEAVLARAQALREALFGLFTAAAAGAAGGDEDLAAVNRELPAALARRCLTRDGGGYRWCDAEDGGGPDLAAPLAPVARSAAELLASGDLALVRECDADTCRWLFLDRSRNRSRRWCDMKVCGNRAKVRRHYRRQRAEGG
jgi:predicted RNA-binding Zn ribbon-like protein